MGPPAVPTTPAVMAPDHLSPISVSGARQQSLRASAGRIIGQYPLLPPTLYYCFYYRRRREEAR